MSYSDWQLWETSAAERDPSVTGWGESYLLGYGFSSQTMRWTAVAGNTNAWIGQQYNGLSSGLFPNRYILVSAATVAQGFIGTQDNLGFLVHNAVDLSGTVPLTSIDGILIALYGLDTTISGGQLRLYEIQNGTGSLRATGVVMPRIGVNSNQRAWGWVHWQAAVLIDATRPAPALPVIRTFYRYNAGPSFSATPGGNGWTGWISLYDHISTGNPSYFNQIATGAAKVSMVRRTPGAWSGSLSYARWDHVRVELGTEI